MVQLVQIGVIMRLATFTTGSADRIGAVDVNRSVIRDATDLLAGAHLAAVIARWEELAVEVDGDGPHPPAHSADRQPMEHIR
jgi:hypothetical protein